MDRVSDIVKVEIDGVTFIFKVKKEYHKHEDTITVHASVNCWSEQNESNLPHTFTWLERNE